MDNAIVGLIVVAIVIVLLISFFGSSNFGSGFSSSLFSSGDPIASGPGGSEIQNPQPARLENEGSFFGLFPSTPRVAGAQNPPAPTPGTPMYPRPAAPTPAPQNKKPGYSRYEKMVRIVHIERSGKTPADETIELQNGSSFFGSNQTDPITVTGWNVENRVGTRFSIPGALNIPLIDADTSLIRLPAGGNVIISTGTNAIGNNFRENACTGYFNELYVLIPTLSNSCIDDNPEVSALLNNANLSSKCIDFIRAIPSCRLAKYTTTDEQALGPACIDYVNKNYSYTGCVKNFRDSRNFLKNTWRVFLGLSWKMYDPIHDRITLRDEKGLIVDVFEY